MNKTEATQNRANGLPRAMWRHETRRLPRAYVTHLLGHLLLRIILLIAVCCMAFKVTPRIQCIPQDKLLCDYKRPRRYSCFPIWVMAILIVFTPLAIFCLLSKDFRETIEVILTWSLSLSATAMITEVLKLSVGRPRPDFFYRCYPDGIMSRAGELQCTGNVRDIMEGRKSFPSGHTSLSFASLGMLSLLAYGRWRMMLVGQSRFSQLVWYVLPLVIATAIGISRCLDNRHHWEDVLVGAFIGFSTSYICYRSNGNACEISYYLEEANETPPLTLHEEIDKQWIASTSSKAPINAKADADISYPS